MSTTIAEEPLTEEQVPAVPSRHVASWVGILLVLAIVVGGLTAVFWANVLDLPSYRVHSDGSATVSERALTEFVSADAWFVISGAVVGLGLGIVTWRWFKPLGWPTALLAAGSALIAGVVCWQVGQLLGPGPFDERLAAASPGDLVPIAVQLRSPSALAVWAFAAVTPVLLASSLGPDEDSDRPRRRRSTPVPADSEPGTVDERGVLTVEPDEQKAG